MNKCAVCFGNYFHEIYESKYDFSITSDNQKIEHGIKLYECPICGHLQTFPNEHVLEKLYNEYTVDVLSSDEKRNGIGKSRCENICENILEYIPRHGNILDVGTGFGSMLKSIAAFSGNSKLYGFDLTSKFADELSKIPHFDCLFTDMDAIELEFDLITVVHTLEHVTDTEVFLQKMKQLLKQDGVLMIQVPNVDENWFDIFVYDHISHFNKRTLFLLLSKFFNSISFAQKTIGKEITLLCRNDANKINTVPSYSKSNNESLIISSVKATFDELEKQTGRLAVFGTSPVCTFFAMIIGDKLVCFFDEDVQRQGKIHLGVQVLSPKEYDGVSVILPFPPAIADSIKARLSNIKFIPIWSAVSACV